MLGTPHTPRFNMFPALVTLSAEWIPSKTKTEFLLRTPLAFQLNRIAYDCCL
jgi:hypothetical protein